MRGDAQCLGSQSIRCDPVQLDTDQNPPMATQRTHWCGDTRPRTVLHTDLVTQPLVGEHTDVTPSPSRVTCHAGTWTRRPLGNETRTDKPGNTPTQPTQTHPETPNRAHRHTQWHKHNLCRHPAPRHTWGSHAGHDTAGERQTHPGAPRHHTSVTQRKRRHWALSRLRLAPLPPAASVAWHQSLCASPPGSEGLTSDSSLSLPCSGSLWIHLSVSICLSLPVFPSYLPSSLSTSSVSVSQYLWLSVSICLLPSSLWLSLPLPPLPLCLCVSLSISVSVSNFVSLSVFLFYPLSVAVSLPLCSSVFIVICVFSVSFSVSVSDCLSGPLCTCLCLSVYLLFIGAAGDSLAPCNSTQPHLGAKGQRDTEAVEQTSSPLPPQPCSGVQAPVRLTQRGRQRQRFLEWCS